MEWSIKNDRFQRVMFFRFSSILNRLAKNVIYTIDYFT